MANIYTADQKQAKRAAIMQAAISLFTQRSYLNISMQAISETAGISKGTIFHYFATKEDLFMSLLLEHYQAYFHGLITQLAPRTALTSADFIQLMTTETATLIQHEDVLVRLNAIRGPILEGKANMAETVTQRNRLYAVSQELGQLLAVKTSQLLTPAQFSHLFVIQSGIISGLMNMSSLARFDHTDLQTTYPDFEIDLVPEAQRQMTYYLTAYLKEVSHAPR
ncbi:MAG TPA: TetR/AcrR family transcriptional regulator [Candidatus Levilactobacillus faecigallinarum]|uniref:TetR/AcrR family transcriptional regulator n=1 Tax=Candidatus Levilactobacillus faecigallinarum TaxID=2838638 RepID=A0A9D1U4M5_9LACO|nr:TetR/AcrR family transcriptional regulator [Candidatus Levilactobacillus faecigallinarum]